MECLKCNGKLTRRRMGAIEGCFGTIFLEIAFWAIAGVFAIFLHKIVDSIYMFIAAFITLVILAHYLDNYFATYKCQLCKSEFSKGELKK